MRINLVVTGMHRSGTTWLGRVISQIKDYAVIHEPFNYELGIKRVPAWYLDPKDSAHSEYMDNAFKELESGEARFQWRFRPNRPLKSIASRLVGTKASRIYRTAIADSRKALAIKDPFLVRMAPTLAKHGYKVLISVRHPGAILHSLMRMGWPTTVQELNDGKFVAPNGVDENMAKVSAMWSALYDPVIEYLNQCGEEQVFVADHSVIFRDVERFGTSLVNFLGLEGAQSDLMQFLTASTSGQTVTPSHNKLHDFSRNSRRLAGAWRSEHSAEVLAQVDNLLGAKLAKLRDASHNSIARFSHDPR